MKRLLLFLITLLCIALVIAIAESQIKASNFIDNMKATQKIIDAASATQTYVGEANTSSNTGDSTWRIYRVAVSGNLTYIQYANYSVEFDKAWARRATYNYGLNP